MAIAIGGKGCVGLTCLILPDLRPLSFNGLSDSQLQKNRLQKAIGQALFLSKSRPIGAKWWGVSLQRIQQAAKRMADAKPQITLKTVLHSIQEAGTEFSIKFRKEDGSVSIKPRVKKNPTAPKSAAGSGGVAPKKDLASIRRNMNHAGALLLYDCVKGQPFECKIRRLVEFNGMVIFHNY